MFFVNAIKKIAANLRNFFKENPLEAKTEYGQALLEAMNKVENRVQELWDKAVTEGIRAENKNVATEGGIKYKSRDDIHKLNISWDSDNSSTIKKQMQEHLPEISSLPIAKEFVFDKQNGDYVQQLKNILKVWNYQINRQDGISFLFDDEAIKAVRHYVHSDEEAAAAIVAPYVLKRGKIITGHKNHKNKGLVSITIGAPVKINGQLAYEGVAVKFDKKDRVHSLRIVDTNGNQFVFYKQEKTKSSTNRAGSEESESDLPSNFPSENSLPQAESENNSFSKKSSDRFNDTDYLSAVERGDMATAQKMVDKAAKQWNAYSVDGKSPLKVYHGTLKGGFNKFGGRHDYWYFSNSKEYSNVFAGYKENGEPSHLLKTDTEHFYNPKIYEAYLKIQKPFITDDIDIIEDAFYWDRALPETMRSQGYDALMLKDLSQIIVLYPENIKSADPVTYDDDGNVIPLSERFNEDNKDIRYQDRTDPDYFDELFDMGDDLFEDESKRQTLNELIDKYPDDALSIIKHAAEQTIENVLTKTKSVKLDDKAYLSIARKFMQDYNISRAANPGEDAYLVLSGGRGHPKSCVNLQSGVK